MLARAERDPVPCGIQTATPGKARVSIDSVPKLAEGINLRELSLTAVEGFVLSRIDGSGNVADICALTGLTEIETLGIIERLARLGAILIAGSKADEGLEGAVVQRRSSIPGYDPKDLDEDDVEITRDERKAILETFHGLEDLSFYDLLQVEHTADRKQIREAYFRLSKQFHPDTQFRKRLGSFKQKLEIIFRSLTQAYDVLSNKEQRADYDAYIAEQIKGREMERQMREAAQEAERMERELVESVRRARRQARTRREAEQRRRRALAQKLAAMSGRQIVDRGLPTQTQKPRSTAETVADVRKLLQGSSQVERLERAKRHAAAAAEALKLGHHVAAANALRLACTLDPRNEGYQEDFKKANALAQRDLSEGYAKQGKFEEQLGHFDRACEHYVKAAEGNPDSGVFAERAAAMLVVQKQDLRKAQEYAARGVAKHPKDAKFRLTLARVFVELNLHLNAKREIETALELEPKNADALELLKVVKKKI